MIEVNKLFKKKTQVESLEDKIRAYEFDNRYAPVVELPKLKVEEIKVEEVKTPIIESLRAQILREHGGLESNIPVNSGYWQTK